MNIAYDNLQEENDHTINIVEHVVQPPPPPKKKITFTYNDQLKHKPNHKSTRALAIMFNDFDI